jgi:hypothetical protein
MRPTLNPDKRPDLTSWRTVSAEQPQRSASMSGVKGLVSLMPASFPGASAPCPSS